MNKGDVIIFLNSIKIIEKELSCHNDINQRVFDELSAMKNILNKYYNVLKSIKQINYFL